MSKVINEDRLAFGVEYQGKLHSEFALRLPTIKDNIAVFEVMPGAVGIALNAELVARCLTRLGEIPVEQIQTPGWLAEQLVDDDYDVLWSALQALKKKRKAANDAAIDSASPC